MRICYTLADHLHNEFIPLGDTTEGPENEVKAFFNTLPEDGADSKTVDRQYLADLWDADGIVATKSIGKDVCQKYLADPIEQHEKRGLAYNRKRVKSIFTESPTDEQA